MNYEDVDTRFLRNEERLILSQEQEMPLVIEAKTDKSAFFLQTFVNRNAKNLLNDVARYGAVLLRGFAIESESDFEKTILQIQGLNGMSEAFMSEEGRIHADGSKYILHTNAVYKTGGTLYLGGFHSENYYSPDVPGYICFACFKPSQLGGETGLINMKKIYQHMDDTLKLQLEKQPYFVAKWLVEDVISRYQISRQTLETICKQYNLPLVGEGKHQFIYMYKPSVFINALTQEKSLQINLFEIYRLNANLRRCFMQDYQSKEWFWHRVVWKMPKFIFKAIKFIYIIFASFFHSPKNALCILWSKIRVYFASKKPVPAQFHETRVGQCFTPADVKHLAQSIRDHYCSFLWKKGDILIVDNTQVMHAGMPGAGPRLIRAMICNPMDISYMPDTSGTMSEKLRDKTIGEAFLSN